MVCWDRQNAFLDGEGEKKRKKKKKKNGISTKVKKKGLSILSGESSTRREGTISPLRKEHLPPFPLTAWSVLGGGLRAPRFYLQQRIEGQKCFLSAITTIDSPFSPPEMLIPSDVHSGVNSGFQGLQEVVKSNLPEEYMTFRKHFGRLDCNWPNLIARRILRET